LVFFIKHINTILLKAKNYLIAMKGRKKLNKFLAKSFLYLVVFSLVISYLYVPFSAPGFLQIF